VQCEPQPTCGRAASDLVFDRFWSVRISKAGGFDCVGGGTERVRAHVADGDGLTGGCAAAIAALARTSRVLTPPAKRRRISSAVRSSPQANA